MEKKENREQEIQRKYVELQLLERQVKHLHAQIQQLEQQIANIDEISDAMHQLAEAKGDTELLVPISAGIFFKGKLVNAKEVLVNVGSNTIVRKSSHDTQTDLQEQVVQMRQLVEDRVTKLQELSAYAQRLQEELAKMVEEHV